MCLLARVIGLSIKLMLNPKSFFRGFFFIYKEIIKELVLVIEIRRDRSLGLVNNHNRFIKE